MDTQQSDASSFLLLLPPAPSDVDHADLKAAFGDTLRQVLKEVASASQETRDAAVLEIALACPHLVTGFHRPRADSYAQTQTIVAGVYKLICVIAAQDGINIEDADGVEIRVLLVAWSPEASVNRLPQSSYGPVVSLRTLAACQRPWQYAFGVEGEHGEAFVRAFVEAKKGQSFSPPVSTINKAHDASDSSNEGVRDRHFSVAVGGTFDHIHVGHKLLLTMTLFAVDEPISGGQLERSLVIGITGDELLKNKKYAEHLESWHDRQQSVERFIRSLVDFRPPGQQVEPSVQEVRGDGPNGHAVNTRFSNGLSIKGVEIWDPFGPTITDEHISALIISAETRAGGKAVNDKRTEKGWSSLQVLEVDVLDPEEGNVAKSQAESDNFGSKLSSTEIRKRLSTKHASSL